MPLGRADRDLCESQTRRRVGRSLPVSRSGRRRREPERHPLQHHGDDLRRLPEWHAWLPGIDRSKGGGGARGSVRLRIRSVFTESRCSSPAGASMLHRADGRARRWTRAQRLNAPVAALRPRSRESSQLSRIASSSISANRPLHRAARAGGFSASARGNLGTWELPAYSWSVPALGLTGFTARTRSTSMTTSPAPPSSTLVLRVTNGAAKIRTITTSRSS